MNYLAHALLAAPEDLDIAANLLGEFVRGRLHGAYPPPVEAGIRAHRRIDTWTDAHPVHRRSRNRLAPPFRRYAGILVDVYYDHFLARHFGRFSEEALPDFARRVYTALRRHRDLLPGNMQAFAVAMERHDLLTRYAGFDGIAFALTGIGRRLSRPNPLARGGEPLRENYAALEADFLAFFPQLAAWSADRHRA